MLKSRLSEGGEYSEGIQMKMYNWGFVAFDRKKNCGDLC